MAQDIEENENSNIDAETRTRALASVASLKPDEKPGVKPVAAPGMDGRPVAAGTLTKKTPIVTKEELEKSGLSLRDYMNKQQGLTRRNAPSPSRETYVGSDAEKAASEKAFLDFTRDNAIKKAESQSKTESEISNFIKKQNYLDKSKNLKRTAEKLRSETPGVVATFSKGGAVSASSRGDGIAQRGKTRGRMC